MWNTYRHQIRLTVEKLESRLQTIAPYVYREQIPLEVGIAPGTEDPTSYSAWGTLRPGEFWGVRNEWRWLRTTTHIPAAWAGRRVAVRFVLADAARAVPAEALVYVDGVLRQGVDPFHHEILLSEAAEGREVHALLLRAWTAYFEEQLPTPAQPIFQGAWLVQVEPTMRTFFHSAEVALGAARAMDTEALEYHRILNAVDAAFLALDWRALGSHDFYESVPAAQGTLDDGLRDLPLRAETLIATGHAHIDVAWLWRLQNTREKAQHTFANVLRLMEQYPDFHFTQSQAQLYAYVQRDAPDLMAQIKERVQEGRWEVTGGTWVEPDCNLISGESLVRQFLVGRGLFRELFGPGVDTPILWLPDTFGYSWALPQIIKRSGMEYFMTSKISWNQYNRMPYDSFWWRGIDGTEVLTHFMTAPGGNGNSFGATYNAMVTADEVARTWAMYQQKDAHSEVFTAFGYGDGGGGPTLEMLERLDRMKAHPGLPQVQQRSAVEFFDNLAADAARLPTWNGELYLEYHRGTYTTQARNKHNNRQAELLYQRAEYLAAMATLAGHSYPRQALAEGWRLVLLNQFHDIIPGSSIRAVYEDSMRDYARIFEIGRSVIASSLAALAETVAGSPGDVLAFDSAPHTMRLLMRGQGSVAAFTIKRTTAMVPVTALVSEEGATLENGLIRVTFNLRGEIVSLYDKEVERELIPLGEAANVFQLFEDRPIKWDAWDIDNFFEDSPYPVDGVSFSATSISSTHGEVEIRLRALESTITQTVALRFDSRLLEFRTEVDWQARHKLLKVAFPMDLLTPRATFEIQFGHVERPTHRNTSWDWARFESVGHRWAQLAEGNYAVSLLNTDKYGYDVHNSTLRLSLLRSPSWPDASADLGAQQFTYALLLDPTHDLRLTLRAAHALNQVQELYTLDAGTANMAGHDPRRYEISISDFMTVSAVKGAEDGRGLIIRAHESLRHRGKATLRLGFAVSQVFETNLMEEDEAPLPFESTTDGGTAIPLYVTPFQIRTLRVIPA
jgi:alpha-mannosidase